MARSTVSDMVLLSEISAVDKLGEVVDGVYSLVGIH
jgi:hypothetical protein